MDIASQILNGEDLSPEEAYTLFTDEKIDTMDLVNEAYQLRKYYYGHKVKLNMILNAKSGICPEDCGYCGQSREMKKKQRYALIPENQITEGAKVA
ncbi:biotin synthase BioB, partial [Staphylococcus felis]